MTWERALEADARLAAKNSVLIRAALRQSFDPERAFIGYQNTTPDDSLTLPQQRSRARSWAIMNIRPNLEPLRQVLIKIWAEAYALGDTAAREAIEEAKRAQKADAQGMVDWSKWKPGDAAQAIILKPPRAFQRLLEGAGITLKGFSDTTLTDIGNSIGEAIELGLDAKRSAKLIGNHVANPARALSIAITEQNRAISTATQNRYLEAGLREQTWLVFEPCKICAQNAGQKVSIGAPFASGNTQPPAHPNCRCALAPVIPGFDDPANTAGSITEPPTTPEGVVVAQSVTDYRSLEDIPANKIEEFENFQLRADPQFSNAGSTPTPQMKEALVSYKQADYRPINEYARNPDKYKDELLKRNSLEKAGEIFAKTAQKAKDIDAAMEIAPRTKEAFISYRGVSGDEIANFLDSLAPGTVFEDAGFASTSINFSIARDFTTIGGGQGKTRILRIINPEGSKGIMLDAFWGTQGTEGEWLLPRGTKFEVIDRLGSTIDVKVVQQ
jgi:hypothetical protein